MRICGRWAWIAAATMLMLVAAPAALADNAHGPKVDDRVALAADSASATAQIPVIVFGANLDRDPSLSGLTHKHDFDIAVAGTVEADQLDALAADPSVAYVAPDVAMTPLAKPVRSGAPLSFPGLKSLYPVTDGAPAAWARGLTGEGVGIAVIDSGLDPNDFGSRVQAKTGPLGGADTYGHGSIVADVAAGVYNACEYAGIAPAANVIDVSVAYPAGTYTSDVLAALVWVLVNKQAYNIRVVNLSLGETTPSTYTSSILDTAVELLWQNGIVVVAAAGNLGAGSAQFAPANDPFAISVGATDTMGTADPSDDRLTPWSTFGTTLDGFTKPDVVAPGRLVPGYLAADTTLGAEAPAENWVADDYVTISGTSFAAPQVSGAAAILLQEHPSWTPDQVKWVLARTARPVPGSTAGTLDLAAATSLTGNPPSANAGVSYSGFGLPTWVDNLLSGATWQHNSWNQNNWNHNSWNAADWNHNSWNGDAWDHNSWNHNSWNDEGWH